MNTDHIFKRARTLHDSELMPLSGRELRAICDAHDALIAVLRVVLGALRESRIVMSITPTTDAMPGYLAELNKSQITPALAKVDAAIDAINETLKS